MNSSFFSNLSTSRFSLTPNPCHETAVWCPSPPLLCPRPLSLPDTAAEPATMSVREVTSAEFYQLSRRAEGKLLVTQFTATWCGPCRRVAPQYEALARRTPDVEFVKVRMAVWCLVWSRAVPSPSRPPPQQFVLCTPAQPLYTQTYVKRDMLLPRATAALVYFSTNVLALSHHAALLWPDEVSVSHFGFFQLAYQSCCAAAVLHPTYPCERVRLIVLLPPYGVCSPEGVRAH